MHSPLMSKTYYTSDQVCMLTFQELYHIHLAQSFHLASCSHCGNIWLKLSFSLICTLEFRFYLTPQFFFVILFEPFLPYKIIWRVSATKENGSEGDTQLLRCLVFKIGFVLMWCKSWLVLVGYVTKYFGGQKKGSSETPPLLPAYGPNSNSFLESYCSTNQNYVKTDSF